MPTLRSRASTSLTACAVEQDVAVARLVDAGEHEQASSTCRSPRGRGSPRTRRRRSRGRWARRRSTSPHAWRCPQLDPGHGSALDAADGHLRQIFLREGIEQHARQHVEHTHRRNHGIIGAHHVLAHPEQIEAHRPVRLVNSSVRTKTYSSQPRRNEKIAIASMPDLTCGSTTRRNACRREAPSVIALISMSQGTASKKPFITKIAKGSSSAATTSMTPVRVSSRPTQCSIRKIGMISVIAGKACRTRVP